MKQVGEALYLCIFLDGFLVLRFLEYLFIPVACNVISFFYHISSCVFNYLQSPYSCSSFFMFSVLESLALEIFHYEAVNFNVILSATSGNILTASGCRVIHVDARFRPGNRG